MPILALLFLILQSNTLLAEERLIIGAFSTGDLQNWEVREFHQQTAYQIVTDSSGSKILKADSKGAASGLVKKWRIDLESTPFLNWRWKISNFLTPVNEQTKAGDDYAARIYVVLDGGLRFWNSQSINYVWAGNTAKYSIWPNAYAGSSVQMLALRSKEDQLNTWYSEKRNVRNDFKNLLGRNIRYIDAVALMTDTDDSRETATAYYGDIYFTAN